MCGIVGVLRFGEPAAPSYNTSAFYLATALLEASESRGKDATGVTALFDDGNFFVQKMAVSATEFVGRTGGKPDDYEGLLALLRGYSKAPFRCLLGHCRKKSAGALSNTDNHPIKAGNILGVHNGTLKNDDEIFKNLDCKRDGKVDSEAIFRLLQFFTHDCTDPFTMDALEETCKRLEGTFSFLAFNANNPYQVVSARDGRPAEYCLVKPLGLVLIASEKKFIDLALYNYNKLAKLFPTGNEETAFVPLTKSDVEHTTLAVDTMAIFDMTKEVGADTKIEELYTTRKMPFMVNRIWKSTVTTTYNGNTYGTNRNNAANKTASNTQDKKTETTQTGQKQGAASTAGTSSSNTTVNEDTGRVWNANFNKFVKGFGKKALVLEGAIINTETKSVTDLVEGHLNISKDAAELAKTRSEAEVKKTAEDVGNNIIDAEIETPVENFSTGEAVSFVDLSPKQSVKKNNNVRNNNAGKEIIKMKEGIEKGKISVAGDLGAKEAAIDAAKDLRKFKSASEVAEFLDIDEVTLDELPPEAMANRLIKRLFSQFYTQGWLNCYENKDTEKLDKAEKHLRVLKTLQTGLIQELADAEEDDEKTLTMVAETARTLSESGELSKGILQNIFSTGDIRKSAVLRRIITAL
jgi:hypothetical protein